MCWRFLLRWERQVVRDEREYWHQHIQAHRQSGSTQTAYCLRHGLHPKTYRSWRRRLQREGALLSVSAPTGEVEAGVVEGVEELAYPFSRAGSANGSQAAGLVATPVQRRNYSDAEKQQFVLAAIQSGLPVERYARMSGLTPSALHRWKHKFAIRMGILPGIGTPPQSGFASVTIASPAETTSPGPDPATSALKAAVWNTVEIALGNGRRLSVDVRVDGVVLRRLMAILEAPT